MPLTAQKMDLKWHSMVIISFLTNMIYPTSKYSNRCLSLSENIQRKKKNKSTTQPYRWITMQHGPPLLVFGLAISLSLPLTSWASPVFMVNSSSLKNRYPRADTTTPHTFSATRNMSLMTTLQWTNRSQRSVQTMISNFTQLERIAPSVIVKLSGWRATIC